MACLAEGCGWRVCCEHGEDGCEVVEKSVGFVPVVRGPDDEVVVV